MGDDIQRGTYHPYPPGKLLRGTIRPVKTEVGVHELVRQLPQGYDTPVGEQGKLLASGVRKRVALTRAVLHKPKLLLLDDLSAEMDPESEEAINHVIKALSKL